MRTRAPLRRARGGMLCGLWLFACAEIPVGGRAAAPPSTAGEARLATADTAKPPAAAVPLERTQRPPPKPGAAAYATGKSAYKEGDFESARRHFKRAYKLDGFPVALYAMAQCDRQLRRYTRALRLFARALEESGHSESPLSPRDKDQTKFQIGTILEEHLISVKLRIPEGTRVRGLRVNGAPLLSQHIQGNTHYLVGAAEPGEDESDGNWGDADRPPEGAPPADGFAVLTEPGELTFELALEGKDGLARHVQKVRGQQTIMLDPRRWPARVVVRDAPAGARVSVSGPAKANASDPVRSRSKSLGTCAPQAEFEDLEQGLYQITVAADGFEPESKELSIAAGQSETVAVELTPKPTIDQRWWFWAAVVGVPLLAATVAAAIAAPTDPQRGTLGWGVDLER